MRLTVFLTASIMGVTIAVKTDFAGLNEAGAMEDTQNACQEDEIMKKSWRRNVKRMVLAAGFTLALSCTAYADETTFVAGTSVNGLGISNMTVEQATQHIADFYASDYKLTIKEKGGKTEVISGPEIGYSVGLPEGCLQQILDQQNAVSYTHLEIISVADTKHAYGLRTAEGLELLIHVGLETVHLNGECFQVFVKPGDKDVYKRQIWIWWGVIILCLERILRFSCALGLHHMMQKRQRNFAGKIK